MDILQPLPLCDWTKLAEYLRRDWPKYLLHYSWVINARKWKTKDPQTQVEIYCPDSQVESGVFIGVAVYGMRFVIVFALDESMDLLQRTIVETKRFDWSDEVIIASTNFQSMLEKQMETKSVKPREINFANCRIKLKEQCLKSDVNIPDGYELRRLNGSYANLIHSLWLHSNIDKSFDFIELSLSLNGGIGLFSKVDDSLVSWIAQNDFGGLGFLQTVDEHKRKGFARLMVQLISKSIAEEQNLDSISFVEDYNESSRKLFDSLGYETRGTIAWYIL